MDVTPKPSDDLEFLTLEEGLGPGADLEDIYFEETTEVMTEPPRSPPKLADEVMAHWLAEWRARQVADRDNILIIDGKRRSGKSTLALLVCLGMDPTWGLDRVAFSAAEMLRMYGARRNLARGSWVLYDEAVYGLLSRRASSDENSALVQACYAAGKLGISVVLCIPDLFRLDVAFRDEIADFRISVTKRGRAMIHTREDRIVYPGSPPLRLFKDPTWNPIRWDPLPRDGIFGELNALAAKRVRQRSDADAEKLERGGYRIKLSGSDRPLPYRDYRKRVRCGLCGTSVVSGFYLRTEHYPRVHPKARPPRA